MIGDYAERQVDLELLQSISVATGSPTEVFISNVNSQPKMVTGIQKAIQRYVSVLLTVIGDVKFDPELGSTFLEEMLGGSIGNMGYLSHLFNVSSNNAIRALNTDDDNSIFGDTKPDERIVSAELADAEMDYSSGSISLTVNITTEAGSEYSFIVPIATQG